MSEEYHKIIFKLGINLAKGWSALTNCMLGNFSCFGCHLLLFFSEIFFSKKSFRTTLRVSNSLNPDQDRCFVGPHLGPNCSQMLSADDKSPC